MCYVKPGSHCSRIVRQLLDLGPATSNLLNPKRHLLKVAGSCCHLTMRSYRYNPPAITSSCSGNIVWRRLTVQKPSLTCLQSGRGFSRETSEENSCHFSFLPLDRAGHKRENARAYLRHEKTKFVIFVDGMPVLARYQDSTAHMSFWLGKGNQEVSPKNADAKTVEFVPFVVDGGDTMIGGQMLADKDPGGIFLGIWKHDNETPVFAQDVGSVSDEFMTKFGLTRIDARSAGPLLCAEDSSLLALSHGLLQWHKNAGYCSRTGKEASEIMLGGHARRVPATDNLRTRSLYPRIDPAVIVVAMHGDWFLLGRKASWQVGRYSLLAGFMELGETPEQASVREVYEESGVQLCLQSLQYQRSQPWPFPQSLMVGFKGTTLDFLNAPHGFDLLTKAGQTAAKHVGLLEQEISLYQSHLTLPEVHIDEKELEDARFFHSAWLREQLQSNGRGNFRIPGKHALANMMINQNLENVLVDDEVSCQELGQIPDIALPTESTTQMKYILLRVSVLSVGGAWRSKLIIRGDPCAAYHNHIFTATKSEIAQLHHSDSLQLDVLGGGRIQIDASEMSISVYGFSAAFGQAPHEISGGILRSKLPFYSIHVSYDGY